MPAYRFPLSRQQEYKGQLVFRSIEMPPADADVVAQGIREAVSAKKAEEAAKKRAEDTTETAAPDQSDAETARLLAKNKPTPASAEDMAQHNGKGEATQPILRTPVSGNSSEFVSLYLPPGLQFREAASYDNIDMGIGGAAIEQGVRSGSGIVNSILSAGKEEIGNLVDNLTGGSSIAAVRASKYFGDTVQNGVRAGLRVTPNPNTRALFKSIPLREFTFQFKLQPESEKEAEAIRNIIRWFRKSQLPGTISVGSLSVGYEFPNPMQITALYDGKPIPGTKFLPAYLRDISITYNSQNMSFYKGGDWSSVDLSVSFMETVPLTSKDID